jgi:tribbles-like protein
MNFKLFSTTNNRLLTPSLCLCDRLIGVPHQILPVNKYQEYLQGYVRTQGHRLINEVQEAMVCGRFALVVFQPAFGDLHSYVRHKKRLKESEAVSLFHQIATIVADCHQAGIVLRDLKLRKFVFADSRK